MPCQTAAYTVDEGAKTTTVPRLGRKPGEVVDQIAAQTIALVAAPRVQLASRQDDCIVVGSTRNELDEVVVLWKVRHELRGQCRICAAQSQLSTITGAPSVNLAIVKE